MANQSIQSNCLVLHADKAADIDSRVRYKNPWLFIEQRTLNALLPGYVRLKIIYAGICGTDVHLVHTDESHFLSSSAPVFIPKQGRVIGHEAVAEVVAVGSMHSQFKPGDIVGLESIIACQLCEPCRRGNFNQCVHAKLVGLQTDGVFSSIIDLPESIAYKVNAICKNDDDLKAMACLEPASVAWMACNKAALGHGERVIIFGGGPIGYFCAMLARLIFGAAWVGLVEPLAFRREHATAWCDEVFDVTDARIEQTKCDVVIEASGFLNNIQRVVPMIKPNGRVILLARSGQALNINMVDHLITNAISIMGVRGHLGGVFGRIIDLYAAGKLPLYEAVTGMLDSMDALKECLTQADNIVNHHCKVLVNF